MSILIPKNPFLSGIPILLGMAPKGNSYLKFLVLKEPHESGLASSHSIEPFLWALLALTPPFPTKTGIFQHYLCTCYHSGADAAGLRSCSLRPPELTCSYGSQFHAQWELPPEMHWESLLHHMGLLPPQLPTSRRLQLVHKCFSLHALWWDSTEPHIT